MADKNTFFYKVNNKIIFSMLLFFLAASLVVSGINYRNLKGIYEKNFTKNVLLTNALIATLTDGDDVEHYVTLLSQKGQEFKEKQAEFNENREQLVRLEAERAPQEEIEAVVAKMEAFHAEMDALKTERYWETLSDLQKLKEVSKSKYVYVLADTGVKAQDGTKLYTYIFDAEDDGVYDKADSDGLGTVSEGEEILERIYKTGEPMEAVLYYNEAPYGELYYAYAPIFDSDGRVVAILGTDVALGEMHGDISKSMALFNAVFFLLSVAIIAFVYFYVSRCVTNPLIDLISTAQKLAEGDVYASVSQAAMRQQSELGMLARSIDVMGKVYQSMIQSSGELFKAASVGKLEVRNDAYKYKGAIRKVMERINDTLDATTLYLNSIPESIFIMNRNFEMYFKNEKYKAVFGDMSAAEFIERTLIPDPETAAASLEELFAQHMRSEASSVVWVEKRCFSVVIREIQLKEEAENSVIVIAVDITELMNEKDKAQAAAKAKSDFLSRMSHEMRTPMNAIIGMAKIADGTTDVSKLKYCLSTIDISSEKLLGIINDVLDMSKIEAGKFELEYAPMNIEKMLMKVCNLVVDNVEKKSQRFNVIMSKDLSLNYIGDELRLSQVLTNILSNAVKFTPEGGKITLDVTEVERVEDVVTLSFVVTDTGIGMNDEQIGRLFSSFEQADGSITRRFGGTGLGLAISKSIIEKMGGKIWVESSYGLGSAFHFQVKLQRSSHQDTITFEDFGRRDLHLLVALNDDDARARFISIVGSFGMTAKEASTPEEVLGLTEEAHDNNTPFDIIFLDHDMSGRSSLDIVNQMNGLIDKNAVIIVTSFLEWNRMEDNAQQININRFITKPLFPSAILDAINGVVGSSVKSHHRETAAERPVYDFSGMKLLLAEDVEINQEIFIALLDETKIEIDVADNGLEAVEKFKANPGRYDVIVMDIQMPKMDGYEATKAIRSLGSPESARIPIIAVTANAFKEDIDRCLECGMNDHLSKPIDGGAVVKMIARYRSSVDSTK